MAKDRDMKKLTPRPTTYNGIQMRSRLEAAWAEQFDALGWPWQYEPHAFATSEGQYLPDFQISPPWVQRPVIVEIKPGYWFQPEHWNGAWEDDSWQDAFERMYDQIWKWQRIVTSSLPDAAFVVLGGANEDGICQGLVAHQDPLAEPDEVPDRCCGVLPVRCPEGCTGLARSVGGACVAHDYPMLYVEPVASLYAAGFDSHAPREDPIDKMLRGT